MIKKSNAIKSFYNVSLYIMCEHTRKVFVAKFTI